jgi:hypothetical protein
MQGAPPVLAAADSQICERGHFTTRNLWVTPYDDSQKYPAGDYVLMSKSCSGLAEWTKEVRQRCSTIGYSGGTQYYLTAHGVSRGDGRGVDDACCVTGMLHPVAVHSPDSHCICDVRHCNHGILGYFVCFWQRHA